MSGQEGLERIRAAAAEVVSEPDLAALLEKAARGERVHAYIGFEPSGTAHVGWMVCTDMVKRLVEAGCEVTILLADWHAQINDKLGGDLAAIQRCGRYMQQAFTALGVPEKGVTYRFANELAADPAYWALVLKVAKHTTLARMRRAMTIMGRGEDEADGDVSKFLYPAMQVADIFHMGIDIAYGGMDQRHAHMLAKDVAPKLGFTPPVAIHTPLVPSLSADAGRMDATASPEAQAIAHKMSKSNPDSGIFIHDSPDDIRRKLKQAHCPAKETAGNPVVALLRLVVWPRTDGLTVKRPAKFGGDKHYALLDDVLNDYTGGALHPMDLKAAVGDAVVQLLEPVRDHFAHHPEDLAFVQAVRKTR